MHAPHVYACPHVCIYTFVGSDTRLQFNTARWFPDHTLNPTTLHEHLVYGCYHTQVRLLDYTVYTLHTFTRTRISLPVTLPGLRLRYGLVTRFLHRFTARLHISPGAYTTRAFTGLRAVVHTHRCGLLTRCLCLYTQLTRYRFTHVYYTRSGSAFGFVRTFAPHCTVYRSYIWLFPGHHVGLPLPHRAFTLRFTAPQRARLRLYLQFTFTRFLRAFILYARALLPAHTRTRVPPRSYSCPYVTRYAQLRAHIYGLQLDYVWLPDVTDTHYTHVTGCVVGSRVLPDNLQFPLPPRVCGLHLLLQLRTVTRLLR